VRRKIHASDRPLAEKKPKLRQGSNLDDQARRARMNSTKAAGQREVYLGRYEALRLIGQGGMGKVYLGRQLDQARSVVIKVMHPEIAADARFRKNFAREMRLMKRFQHPNAVALYDASIDDPERPCIVMEFVPGITLAALLKRHGRLPVAQIGRLLGQLCRVLQAAQAASIMHRDLTLVNMMVVSPDTPHETLKVMDFGLARVGAGPFIALEKLTGTGHSIGSGTPDYMCPEQIRREEVDHRGDLYSVGVVLFQLLTGRLPFDAGPSVVEILLAHVEQQPLTFAQAGLTDSVPAGLEDVVQSCLRKYPSERPQSARELAQRLGEALGTRLHDDEEPTPAVAPLEADRPDIKPHELMDCLDAWMPEQIAVVKLRGFVGDLGGEVLESEPGLIRVRLPGPDKKVAPAPRGLLGWLGLAPTPPPVVTPVIVDLHLNKKLANGQNVLEIVVGMRPERNFALARTPAWRPWCQGICRDLRAYLISR
jgi:serine/threonine-protein kinase